MSGARTVTVVDYAMSNLHNVVRAFQAIGAEPVVAEKGEDILSAERLVLPGVGAFGHGMAELRERGLAEPVLEFARTERPFLGICLGMQMLFSWGEEFGRTEGLGIIEGGVGKMTPTDPDGQRHPLPHVGWNEVTRVAGSPASPVLDAADGTPFYFVHSFAGRTERHEETLAVTTYAGRPVVAAVGRGNVLGCQFHPEKSGPDGLALLERFMAL